MQQRWWHIARPRGQGRSTARWAARIRATRSIALAVASATTAALCAPASTTAEPATPVASSPNVVVVVADDVGFSDLGAYGSEIRTPHIDAIASRGVLFSNFHASPMCSPSRAMLLTGGRRPPGRGGEPLRRDPASPSRATRLRRGVAHGRGDHRQPPARCRLPHLSERQVEPRTHPDLAAERPGLRPHLRLGCHGRRQLREETLPAHLRRTAVVRRMGNPPTCRTISTRPSISWTNSSSSSRRTGRHMPSRGLSSPTSPSRRSTCRFKRRASSSITTQAPTTRVGTPAAAARAASRRRRSRRVSADGHAFG